MAASVIYACSKEAIADTSGDNNTELLDKITALESKLELLENKLASIEVSVDSIGNGNNKTKPYGYVEEHKREKISIYYSAPYRDEHSYDNQGRYMGCKRFNIHDLLLHELEYIYNGQDVTVYKTEYRQLPNPPIPRYMYMKYTC